MVPEALTYVSFGGSNGGMVRDVSEGGVAVATAFAIPEASLLEIVIPADATHPAIAAKGRVAWIAESKRRVGLQFVDLSPGTRQCLRNWICTVQGMPLATERRTPDDWPSMPAGFLMVSGSDVTPQLPSFAAPVASATLPSATGTSGTGTIAEKLFGVANTAPAESAHNVPTASVSTPTAPANAKGLLPNMAAIVDRGRVAEVGLEPVAEIVPPLATDSMVAGSAPLHKDHLVDNGPHLENNLT